MADDERRIHQLLDLTLVLKGLHAAVEIIGGAALYLIPTEQILAWVRVLTQRELSEDPGDWIAQKMLHWAQSFSVGTEHFYAFLLLGHGIVNMAVVISLWRSKLWAYPFAFVVLTFFIFFQVREYTFTHSPVLIILTIIDIAVIWLVWKDYSLLRQTGGRRR